MSEIKVLRNFRGELSAEEIKVINGHSYQIRTGKGRNGIECSYKKVDVDSYGTVSYEMSFTKDPVLAEMTGKATEANIRQVHLDGLIEFDALAQDGKLKGQDEKAVLEVGQIIFTHGNGSSRERVITSHIGGGTYNTVLISGEGFAIDSHIRNYKNVRGIGVYYRENELFQGDLTALTLKAEQWTAAKRKSDAEAAEIAEKAAREKQDYLSQFVKADRRKSSQLLKAWIISQGAYTCSIRSEVYSGGSSLNISYDAAAAIEAVNELKARLSYGNFNSMEDLYEYKQTEAFIVEGHILETFKYVFVEFNEVAEREVKAVSDPVTVSGITVSEYSEKAIVVRGEGTKDIKDRLKELGGRFNFRLQGGAGWIFSKKSQDKVTELLNSLQPA